MRIWSRYHSPHVETSLVSSRGQRLAPERAWPFNPREALSWVPCARTSASPPCGGCGVPVDTARLARAEANPIGEFTEVEYVALPADVSVLRAKIAAGQEIIARMELPQAFVPKGNRGAVRAPSTHGPRARTADTRWSSPGMRACRSDVFPGPQQLGGVITLDVTDAASIAEASRAIERDSGRLDVLVNNAGIILGRPKPSETRLDEVRRVFEVNVFGAVAVTNAMLPLLRRASPAARIVMVSSEIGGLSNHADPRWKYGWFNTIAYPASKAPAR